MNAESRSTAGDSCGDTVENIGGLWENYTNVSDPATAVTVRGRGRTGLEFDVDILPPAHRLQAIPRGDDA